MAHVCKLNASVNDLIENEERGSRRKQQNEDARGDAYDLGKHECANKANGPKESSLKWRWKSGNLLIISLPLGAGIVPVTFMIGAYFHAKDSDMLKLKNNTDVPYISDIGNYKPHSSVFTFGLMMSAMFAMWLIIVRFLQVKVLYNNTKSKANLCSFFVGMLSILGEIMVGSFQLSSQLVMHNVGAFAHFVSFMIFMCIQTFITHRNIDNTGKRNYDIYLVILRGLLSGGVFLCLVIFGIFFAVPSLFAYNRTGYSVAQSAEWAMLSCTVTFLLTFVYDFKDLTCSVNVSYLENKTAGVTTVFTNGNMA